MLPAPFFIAEPRLEDGLPPIVLVAVRAAPRAELFLAAAAPPWLRIFYNPEVSSRASVSISFKFDFQTFTMASAPDEVKKSPPGEKLQVVEEPSWP